MTALFQHLSRLLLLPLCLLAVFVGGQAGAAEQGKAVDSSGGPHRVYIATYRGCEEACEAFKEYMLREGMEVEFIVRSAERDPGNYPKMVEEVKQTRPDLLVTWGTGVTLGMVGPYDGVDPAKHVTDIPTVYMYVGDPVSTKVVEGRDRSRRPNVAGANINVPFESQVQVIKAYGGVQRVGMIYGTNETNSVIDAATIRDIAIASGLEVVEETLPLGADGKPTPEGIETAVQRMAARKPDFLIWVSSSFLIINVEKFTDAAVRHSMPVFSYSELPITKGHALVALYSALSNIGNIAGHQAVRILRDKADPATLPTPNLSRFTLVINMEVAKKLERYPPMSMLRFARLIKS